MAVRLGVVMDPIGSIKPAKDSTLAMLLAAAARGWELHYLEPGDLFVRDGHAFGRTRALRVFDDPGRWYELGERRTLALAELQVILMRKDPPLDMEYFYTTQILERAEYEGCLVVNRPAGLRDVNEKLYTVWFPECCPPTLVTRDPDQVREFLDEMGEIILKPLHAMGGASVFRVRRGDPNTGVILETMLEYGHRFAIVQRFLPEILQGDKRILLVDGEPVPYALARIPAPGEFRGNLAVGGHGEGVALSARERWICERVGPTLREKGLLFVGLDVIGDYLTEINVTSPTCIRELDARYGLDIAGSLLDRIEARLG